MRLIVPPPKSKSIWRKVNSYVRARLVLRALNEAQQRARDDVRLRELGLTGKQLAEAQRILDAP